MSNIQAEFIKAIKRGRCRNVQDLIEKGINVLELDEKDRTPMYHAIKTGKSDVIIFLLDKYSDLTIGKDYDFVSFYQLLKKDKKTALSLLRKMNLSDFSIRQYEEVLQYAMKKNWCCLVQTYVLRARKAKVFVSANHLTLAVFSTHVEIVNILIKAGAEIDAKNRDGETALDVAIYLKNIEMVNVLLEYGADFHIQQYKNLPRSIEKMLTSHVIKIQVLGSHVHLDNLNYVDERMTKYLNNLAIRCNREVAKLREKTFVSYPQFSFVDILLLPQNEIKLLNAEIKKNILEELENYYGVEHHAKFLVFANMLQRRMKLCLDVVESYED